MRCDYKEEAEFLVDYFFKSIPPGKVIKNKEELYRELKDLLTYLLKKDLTNEEVYYVYGELFLK